jgi:hypothetical protein
VIKFELPSHASTSTAASTRGAACGLGDERAASRRLVSSWTLCSAAARALADLASFLSDFSFFSIAFFSSRSPTVCCHEWLRSSRIDARWRRDHQTATSTKAASAVAHVLYISPLPLTPPIQVFFSRYKLGGCAKNVVRDPPPTTLGLHAV